MPTNIEIVEISIGGKEKNLFLKEIKVVSSNDGKATMEIKNLTGGIYFGNLILIRCACAFIHPQQSSRISSIFVAVLIQKINIDQVYMMKRIRS